MSKILWILGGLLVGGVVVAKAAQTNYVGTFFLADPTALTNQLKVNSDGSLNTSVASGSPGASGTPAACTATTVGTGATLILDTVANGTKRGGGGFALPPTAANGIYFSWNSSSPTTTASGTIFYLAPGGTIPFAGAPNTALYAIAAASTVGSCFYE